MVDLIVLSLREPSSLVLRGGHSRILLYMHCSPGSSVQPVQNLRIWTVIRQSSDQKLVAESGMLFCLVEAESDLCV